MEQAIKNEHPTYLFEEVKAIKEGTLATVTHYAIGRNGDADGDGIYIRLFCDWLPMSVMSVYTNEFWRLPKEWKSVCEDAIATGKTLKPKKLTLSDKDDAEDRKILKPLPIAAEIVRFQYNAESDKLSDKRWRFYAIYRLFKWTAKSDTSKIEDKADITRPPSFTGKTDCIEWAIAVGAFPDEVEATTAYDAVRDEVKPLTMQDAPKMYAAWIAHVKKVVR